MSTICNTILEEEEEEEEGVTGACFRSSSHKLIPFLFPFEGDRDEATKRLGNTPTALPELASGMYIAERRRPTCVLVMHLQGRTGDTGSPGSIEVAT